MSRDPERRLSGLDPLGDADVSGWATSGRGRAARDRVVHAPRGADPRHSAGRRRRRLLLSPAGAFGATVAGTAAAAVALSVAGTAPGFPGSSPASAAALQGFDGCDDLAAYYAATAEDQVTPYGLSAHDGAPSSVQEGVANLAAPGPAPAARGARAPGGGFATDSSASTAGQLAGAARPDGEQAGPESLTGTNLQERGVDEPDVAKTDGERLVLLRGAELVVLDVTGETPRVTGRVAVPALRGTPGGGPVPGPAEIRPAGPSGQLLLDGDRVLVLTTSVEYGGASVALPQTPGASPSATPLVPAPLPAERTTLTVVDLSGSTPRLGRSAELDGQLVDARLSAGALRVAVASAPQGLALQQPAGGGVRAEAEALETNRAAVRTAPAQAWLPGRVLRDADGTQLDVGPLLACDAVARPPEPAGVSTLALLTLDLSGDDPLTTSDAAGVVADGATLYASTDRLVVSTSPAGVPGWRGSPADASTSLHAFDTTDATTTTYVASGEVDGLVPGRWGLSERDGLLRVVTTQTSQGATTSSLVVLDQQGDELVAQGRVDGIGKGEDVYAVRFLGAEAYVVTFRRVDPLHVIDLSDPTSPRLAGELKVPGFSSYLHPVGEDRLLGVGQDADPESGAVTGAQASLFDVSDTDAPTQVGTVPMGQGQAFVEQDSRVFAYDAERDVALVPFRAWNRPGADVVGIEVSDDGVQLSGRAQLADAQVLRAFVDGDRVLAVGSESVVVLDLDDGLRVEGMTSLG